MEQIFNIAGRLIYDPPRDGMKKEHRAQKGWLILKLDDQLGSYYRWHVKKFLGWLLKGQAYGLHVSVITDRDDNKAEHKDWKKYNNKLISVSISVKMEQHWKFMVLPVYSEELNNIRTELGLKEKNFHLTIGRI